MFCPKCDKFVPSSANACPNCGIPIITGFSPNYGRGFDLDADDTESRSDAPPHSVPYSDLYDEIPENPPIPEDIPEDENPPAGIGTKLKSFFGFGKN